jgi:hypothetical protein
VITIRAPHRYAGVLSGLTSAGLAPAKTRDFRNRGSPSIFEPLRQSRGIELSMGASAGGWKRPEVTRMGGFTVLAVLKAVGSRSRQPG